VGIVADGPVLELITITDPALLRWYAFGKDGQRVSTHVACTTGGLKPQNTFHNLTGTASYLAPASPEAVPASHHAGDGRLANHVAR
jgi:hypothetical protein